MQKSRYAGRKLKSRNEAEYALAAESALGRALPAGAVVHHVNGDRSDNRKQNLVVCENVAYHNLLHQRMRSFTACGKAAFRKCPICKKYDDPKNMVEKIETVFGKWTATRYFHRKCKNERQNAYNLKKRLEAL